MTAPIIGIQRHRINTDGQGVTTLVAFYGCTLRCKYCINPQCFSENTVCRVISPDELYEEVSIDNLYFIATGGGITFGGGEPLLHNSFIQEFCRIAKPEWKISIETSLNADTSRLISLAPFINHYFIDIKDLNNNIYQAYTSHDNRQLLTNLHLLADNIPPKRVTIRLPLIPGYNTDNDRKASMEKLKEMGFRNFDMFRYIIKKHEP